MIRWETVRTIAAYLILFCLCGAVLSYEVKHREEAQETTQPPVAETEIDFEAFTIYDVSLSRDMQIYTQELCNEYDVAYDLVIAVMFVESGFDENAVNGNCYGMMQVNEINCEELKGIGIEDVKEPKQNIKGGVYLLSKALKRFDLSTALIAYNCGTNKAIKMQAQGITETQYTRKVMRYAEGLKGKERIYKFD